MWDRESGMKIAEHKDRTEYFYNDDAGEVSAVVYQLFPGIEFVYISVHRAEFDFCIFAEHMPFMGIHGMDYLLEAVERYYSRL